MLLLEALILAVLGGVFGLLLAIQLMPLSIAILAYFIYPLLTAITGALLGIERLSLRSLAVAVSAFCGLALMLHAQPGAVQPIGLIAAFGAAITRVITLLVTRARLGGTEARLTTWYSLLAAAIVFVAASLLNRTVETLQSRRPPSSCELSMRSCMGHRGQGVCGARASGGLGSSSNCAMCDAFWRCDVPSRLWPAAARASTCASRIFVGPLPNRPSAGRRSAGMTICRT